MAYTTPCSPHGVEQSEVRAKTWGLCKRWEAACTREWPGPQAASKYLWLEMASLHFGDRPGSAAATEHVRYEEEEEDGERGMKRRRRRVRRKKWEEEEEEEAAEEEETEGGGGEMTILCLLFLGRSDCPVPTVFL